MKNQVVITGVFANSERRHLLRRQLLLSAGELLVEFAITIERDSHVPAHSEEQGLSTPVVATITVCVTLLVLTLVAALVVFGYRKLDVGRARIGFVEEPTKHGSKSKKIEMTTHDKRIEVKSSSSCIPVKKCSESTMYAQS